MTRSTVEAEVLGYSKLDLWLRLPPECGHKILTMPRDFLPYGMATAERVVLEFSPRSLHHDGHGFVVDGEIMRMLDDGETLDATVRAT